MTKRLEIRNHDFFTLASVTAPKEVSFIRDLDRNPGGACVLFLSFADDVTVTNVFVKTEGGKGGSGKSGMVIGELRRIREH